MTLPQALRTELLAGIEVIVGPDGKQCWLWRGERDPRGAGIILFGEPGRKKIYKTKRLVYQAFVGAIRPGKSVVCICNTKGCVRAHHLALVAHKDTLARLRNRPWHNR
jgi:hypothetical protein